MAEVTGSLAKVCIRIQIFVIRTVYKEHTVYNICF